MANTNKKFNSINDQTAQQFRANQNTVEILTKLDQAVNSTESFITIDSVNANGEQISAQIPTIGFLKQKLDQLFKMVKVLSGVDGNPTALQIANNQFKRIVVADLNLEPKPIPAINPVTTFKSDPNWIFDSFLNPKISVELDLTDKIDDDTRTIQSKRFIVEFEKIITLDENGNETIELTTLGNARKSEFEQNYKGKSNIDLVQFVTWLDTPGLINRVDDTLIDQDYFKVEPNRLQYKGDFTVLGTDVDTLNKKLWYILDTLTYYDVSDPLNQPKPIDLKIGDYVNINPNLKDVKSTTVYKVVEVSTITSEYRVRFEQVYGEEPIPVRLKALSIYSNKVKNRKVKVSVGFDEYCVVFLRQIDDINNIVGIDWSPGVGFWTSDLRLDNEAGELFSDYYIKKVYDYGIVIEDLVEKKIPNYYGIKPNAPVLDEASFKVVQTNEHLTQTVEAEKIRDLHNKKNNLLSEIQQIQDATDKQNRLIQTTVFDTNTDRKRAEDELTLLNNKLNTKNQNKFSIVQEILANKKNLNKINPEYHARGFFPMPNAVDSIHTQPQEVVQFEIWYRKLSKSGAENPILTITNLNNSNARAANINTTTIAPNIILPKTINGSFSNWQKYKTDSRKRVQDPITGTWLWSIEDVSDANTPNINQIDLPISPGEKIEIKVKSLSEVGWPETPIESEFSNAITIEFPDDLNNVLNEDEFILKDAQAEDLKVKLERDLETRGLTLHLNSAIRTEDIYYAHKSESIASGFKDQNGKIINLYDQLLAMNNKLVALEELVNKAKGILEIYLINAGNRTRIFSGNNITFNINLEDYLTKTKVGLLSNPVDNTSRTYKNELIQINDFSLLIKNSAQAAPLGILSYRGYGQPSGITPSTFAYMPNDSGIDAGIQAIWIQPDSEILMKVIGTNTEASSISEAPKFATQQNNQWIWLQQKDLEGDYIYTTANQPDNNFFDSDVVTKLASKMITTLHSTSKNLGFRASTNTQVTPTGDNITKITEDINWAIAEAPQLSGALPGTTQGTMGSTIHPVISDFNQIIDTSTQLTKYIKAGDADSILIPINIYVKPFTGTKVHKKSTDTAEFKDNNYISGGGDFPDITTPTIDKNSNNLLTISDINNSNNAINVGDKIIISGISEVSPVNSANGMLLTVVAVTATGTDTVTVNYNAANLTAPTLETSLKIEQIHKKYVSNTNGPELVAYNVLGQVGGDNRYVTNYIDITTTTTSPKPVEHTKKLRFYLEDENNVRPFNFQLNWNIIQYKKVKLQSIVSVIAAES